MSIQNSDQIFPLPVRALYPFAYENLEAYFERNLETFLFEELEDYLSELLSPRKGERERVIWFLDIRLEPEKSVPVFRGSQLKKWKPERYRHSKGLGIVPGQEGLYYPASAIHKILELVEKSESFVLFSDSETHVRQACWLILQHAKDKNINLEDPYKINPGDICFSKSREHTVVVHERSPWNPYSYTITYPSYGFDERNRVYEFDQTMLAKVEDLELKESRTRFCGRCKKGEWSVQWRIQAKQQLCDLCFREWDWENGRLFFD